jgi:hypothetical protein
MKEIAFWILRWKEQVDGNLQFTQEHCMIGSVAREKQSDELNYA